MREELEEKEQVIATLQKELDKEKYLHGQTEITKDKAIRDFQAYQKEMWSKETDLVAIPGYKKHIKELRAEVEEQDLKIADLTEELQRVKAQLREKEQAIATLQAQSQQQLQLTLPLVTDSLDPVVTSEESEVSSQQSPVPSYESAVSNQESEVSRGELIDYIKKRFPKAKINPQNITDAINGKSKKMPEYESTYGFKYVGKKAGQSRFIILSQG